MSLDEIYDSAERKWLVDNCDTVRGFMREIQQPHYSFKQKDVGKSVPFSNLDAVIEFGRSGQMPEQPGERRTEKSTGTQETGAMHTETRQPVEMPKITAEEINQLRDALCEMAGEINLMQQLLKAQWKPERVAAQPDETPGVDTLIAIWSMRPRPGSPEGEAWVRGCKQGYKWGIEARPMQELINQPGGS